MKPFAFKSAGDCGRRLVCARIFAAVIGLTMTTGSFVFPNSGVKQVRGQEPKPADARELKVGSALERELSAGKTDTYVIRLEPGQYINVVVEQLGVNVGIEMTEPSGKAIANHDWWWKEGTESIWVLAESTGDYVVKVSASSLPVAAR